MAVAEEEMMEAEVLRGSQRISSGPFAMPYRRQQGFNDRSHSSAHSRLVLPSHSEPLNEGSNSIMEKVMDVAQKKNLFLASDTDGDGTLDVGELARSLKVLGINEVTMDRLRLLLQQAQIPVPEDLMLLELDFHQYSVLLWHIGFADLFVESEDCKAEHPARDCVRCIDYSLGFAHGTEDTQLHSSALASSVLYRSPVEGTRVRWVDLEVHEQAEEQLPMRRLGVAYHLHPDAVSDSVHLVSAKVETYNNHTHIVLPVISIVHTPTSYAMRPHWRMLCSRPKSKWPLDMELEVRNMSLFVVKHLHGCPADTLISVRPSSDSQAGSTCNAHMAQLRASLSVAYSRLRLGDTAELLHQVMLSLLAMAEQALQTVHEALSEHMSELHGPGGSTGGVNAVMPLTQDIVHIKMIQAVLISLQSQVSSLDGVIQAVLDDQVLALHGSQRVLIERLKTKAAELDQFTEAINTSAGLLISEINNRIKYHHAESNTLLTIVVTIIMPLQVFSGMWGMNTNVPFQANTHWTWSWDKHSDFTLIFMFSLLSGMLILLSFKYKGWF